MKIIIGLGNIGTKYQNTRHNAGFIMLDEILSQFQTSGLNINWKEEKNLKALTAKVPYNGEILLLAKPTTLMNLSGQSVAAILNFFKEPLENLYVIYDDIDLPIGKIRIRPDGSAGTHNGMKSIINDIGSKNFTRIRLGIESRGQHAPAQQELSSFVLSPFKEKEKEILETSIEEAITELQKLLDQS